MIKSIFLALCIAFSLLGNAQTLIPLVTKEKVSFRGLETFGNNVVWVSGSSGTVGRSIDGGKTWEWVSPKGYEALDFRDVEVFSTSEAVIVSAGTPAVILYTSDAGKSWLEVYRNEDPAVFLDGMDFQGSTGYILGDPLAGSFQLLKSEDKGKTWIDVSKVLPLPAMTGEAAFAASGSSLQLIKDNLYVGTGGVQAKFIQRNEKLQKVTANVVPIWAGEPSIGIFSIDFLSPKIAVLVGGNYTADTENPNNILLTKDAGKTWYKPQTPILGYRSSVKYITKKTLIAAGTSGIDLSTDGGMNWKQISTKSFNVIAKSADGKSIYLASSNGTIEKLTL